MDQEETMSLTIRPITELMELSEVCVLEKEIWQSDDPVPLAHALTSVENGGMVIGAYIEDQLIGFQYSFAGFNGKESYLCSYLLGVHPDHRVGGIGEKLKLAQREEAIKKGYDLIEWTYDPLETVNANLNIRKLGGTCSTYKENYYGDMEDGLNAGIPSDRFLVQWRIQDDHVIQRLSDPGRRPQRMDEQLSVIKVDVREDGVPVPVGVDYHERDSSEALWVPVPGEFQKVKEIDSDMALEWRLKTRDVFSRYFQSGWQVVDFVRGDTGNKGDVSTIHYYILQKK